MEDNSNAVTSDTCSKAESLRNELALSEHRLQFRTRQATDLEERKENLRTYLGENYAELEQHATEIAEIMDISLTKSAEVEVTVTFTLQITDISIDTDIDGLVDDMEFDVRYRGDGDLESEDYSVDRSEATEV